MGFWGPPRYGGYIGVKLGDPDMGGSLGTML